MRIWTEFDANSMEFLGEFLPGMSAGNLSFEPHCIGTSFKRFFMLDGKADNSMTEFMYESMKNHRRISSFR